MLPVIDTIVGGASSMRSPEQERVVPETGADTVADTVRDSVKRSETGVRRTEDQVELNLALTREEREAFVTAFSSKQDPATMTDEEKETLQKASERISKFVEDTIAKNADNRERVEKAMSEWYSRLTRGEGRGASDFVNLLRQAAMGNLDDLGR